MRAADIILRRLAALAPIGKESRAALEGLGPVLQARTGQELEVEQASLHPRFVLSGWAARFRDLADGRRQIIGFVLPGEGMGICERPGPIASTPVVALTPMEYVDARRITELAFEGEANDLKTALLIAAALDEAWLIDNVVRLGRQTAIEGMAHLFLELRDRLNVVGLVDGDTFLLPLTQEQLADATGLSAVHVNRTLQSLRADGLIALNGGRLRILRRDMLEALADYRQAQVSRAGGSAQRFPHRPLAPAATGRVAPATRAPGARQTGSLTGRRILVVEDEYMIAQDMRHAFERAGGEVVGPVASVEHALGLLEKAAVDLAVLDVNLGGSPVWPLVDRLQDAGVQMVLATGYDRTSLPDRYADVPRYEKPVDMARMISALSS